MKRGQDIALALAALFYAAGLAWAAKQGGWDSVQWARYPVFLPTALLVLGTVNRFLRSRLLAWALFAAAFVFLVAVLGAVVVQMRAAPETSWLLFGRALAMYGALAMAGLYQLKRDRT